MNKTQLLLDYDGVMLKNTNLSKYQLVRSAKFVQKHTHLTIGTCQHLNKKFYPTYGHTVTMLNKMFNKKVTIEEYDDYVFNKKSISRLDPLVDGDTKKHMKSFENLFEVCDKTNIVWNIFTNAHINWVMHFSEVMGMDTISHNNVIWPESKLELLKPNPKAYDRVEALFPEATSFIFVDDSPVNLNDLIHREKWIPILMTEKTTVNHIAFVVSGAISFSE